MTVKKFACDNDISVEVVISFLEQNGIHIINVTDPMDNRTKKILRRNFSINRSLRRRNKSFLILFILAFLIIATFFVYVQFNQSTVIKLINDKISESQIFNMFGLTESKKNNVIEFSELKFNTKLDGNVQKKKFTWCDEINNWEYVLYINKDDYYRYLGFDRKRHINNYEYFVLEESDDNWIKKIVQDFEDMGKKAGYNKDEIVNMIVSFVQDFEYIEDFQNTGYEEYPKFPIETLYEGGGDCEDTCILMASMLRELNYGTAFLLFDEHMAIGLQGEKQVNKRYYKFEEKYYYFVETTAKGWKVGMIPDEYKDLPADVLIIH